MADQELSRSGSTDTTLVLTTAQKLAAGLATAKRERDLLESAVREFVQLFRTDYAAVLVAQPNGGGRITGDYPDTAKLDGLTLSPDVRLISEYCSRGERVVVESVSGSVLLSQKAREALLLAKLNSLILLPMGQNEGRWIGSVILGLNHDFTLSADTIETAVALSQQVGGLLVAARQIERTNKQVNQFTALLALSETITQVETEDDLAYEVAKAIPTILPLAQFAVLRGNPYAATLDLVARWENGYAQKIHAEQPVTLGVANTPLSLLQESDGLVDVSDFNTHKPALQGLLQMSTRSALASVLQVGQNPIGAMVVESDIPNAYNDADKLIFNQLITQMNVALTRLSASFGLMRSAASSNAVNAVSERMQGETSAYGVLQGGTAAILRVLNAKRVSIQLGTPNNAADESNEIYLNGSGTQGKRG